MTKALLTLVMVSGFQMRYDPAVLRDHSVKHLPRLTSQENGTDIPVEVAPARDQIVFSGNGRTDADSVMFIPLHDASVPDYAKAYPEVTRAAEALRGALGLPAARIAAQLEKADLACIDDGHAFHSHIQVRHFAWGDGISFLTQYSQEGPQPPVNKRLVYLFLGLARGGTHYIRAEFSVQHPSLPKRLPLPATGFRPPVESLEEVLGSITPAQ